MNGYIKKQALMDYCSNQVTRTIDLNDIARFPIAEIYTKADMVSMLTELQLEIEELDTPNNGSAYMDCVEIIQQKINELKESKDGSNT